MEEQNQQPTTPQEKPKKKWYKRWWIWVVLLIITIFIAIQLIFGLTTQTLVLSEFGYALPGKNEYEKKPITVALGESGCIPFSGYGRFEIIKYEIKTKYGAILEDHPANTINSLVKYTCIGYMDYPMAGYEEFGHYHWYKAPEQMPDEKKDVITATVTDKFYGRKTFKLDVILTEKDE